MKTITLQFVEDSLGEDFLGWWHDGGGDQGFHQFLDDNGFGGFVEKRSANGEIIRFHSYTVERDERGDYENLPEPTL